MCLLIIIYCKDPDISGTDSTGINPSGPTPVILVNVGGIAAANIGGNGDENGDENTGSKSDPFLKTLYGRVTIVAVCVAIIIVVAFIVFMVVRSRKQQGAYYEDFDEYDADESGMPNEVSVSCFKSL